jgi:CRP-like cAMP-binding protein
VTSPDAEALRAVPFFQALTSDDLERVARIGAHRSFVEGDAIVERNTFSRGLYVILSGRASVEVAGKTHKLGPGSFFGEMALLSDRPRSATVTALEPLEAFVLETVGFRPFLMKNPSLVLALLDGVVERLREVQSRVERTAEGWQPLDL